MTEQNEFSLIPTKDQDWDKFLSNLNSFMTVSGYRKHNQSLNNEDFAYWKNFDDKYQVGLLIYDFTKFVGDRVSIQFQCMTSANDRIDLTVSKAIELSEFEEMAEAFHEAIKKYQ